MVGFMHTTLKLILISRHHASLSFHNRYVQIIILNNEIKTYINYCKLREWGDKPLSIPLTGLVLLILGSVADASIGSHKVIH
jgi:hypothetical protein